VPDTPGFKVTASDSTADAPLAALQQLLESAIRIALDDTVAGNRERLADQDEIAKALGDDAVKKLMADRGVGGQISDAVSAVKKSFDADRELAGRAEQTVTDVGKAAVAKLAELKKIFG
jgi:hypothetical protein